MNFRFRLSATAFAALALATASLAVGPKGLWFLTDGDHATDALIQGASVSTFAQDANAVLQYPIQYDPGADLFETVGRDQNALGGLYTPAHVSVGLFGNFSSTDGQHLDGTLDTRDNHTYASVFNSSTGPGKIIRYNDRYFNSPSVDIYTSADYVFSVTYSPTRDTLFVGGNGDITEIDKNTGGVINSFATSTGPVRSLAWDATDSMMWYLSIDGSTAFQIDATGNVLQQDVVNLGGNFWGGEIKPGAVPEPTTMAALGLGALALVRRRRSK